MGLGFNQLQIEVSTKDLSGGKEQPACKSDDVTATCVPIVRTMWDPQRLITPRPPWPATGVARIITTAYTGS
jgi:hypothetical protein